MRRKKKTVIPSPLADGPSSVTEPPAVPADGPTSATEPPESNNHTCYSRGDGSKPGSEAGNRANNATGGRESRDTGGGTEDDRSRVTGIGRPSRSRGE